MDGDDGHDGHVNSDLLIDQLKNEVNVINKYLNGEDGEQGGNSK